MAAAAQHAAALATFDVPAVAAKADAALATGGATGLEEARKLFEETLAEWGDEYARLLEEADPPLATREVRFSRVRRDSSSKLGRAHPHTPNGVV